MSTLLAGLLTGVPAASATPSATASGAPAVAHVHAVPAGSTAVRLSWHNPGASGRVATVVRYAKAPDVPASPTAGHAAGRVGAARNSLTVRGLRPATRYAFALFAYYGSGHYAAPRIVRIRTAPDSVRLVQAFARGTQVTVTWRPPGRRTYAGTVVRYTRGGATPGRPTSGSAVPLSDPHARAARLTGLAAGATYAVAIWTRDRAGHYSSAAATRFTTPRTDPVPTGTVQGTVTDAAAHPLAGVAVWAASGAFGDETRAATTGAGGHYSFAAPAGPLTVSYEGANATGGSADATGYQSDFLDVTVPRGGTVTENTALDPGAAVAGQVTDIHGNPLSGVSVYPQEPQTYVRQPGFAIFESTDLGLAPTTGSDGRYLLKGLPPVALQICFGTADAPVTGGASDAAGYTARCERGAVAVAPEAARTIPAAALLPAVTGTVTGLVTDTAGHPVAGAIVELSSHDGSVFASASTTTDGAGHYRAGGLGPGRYDVCADPTAIPLAPGRVGNALTCRFAVATVVRARTVTVDVTLRAAGAVAGRLRGPHGVPVAGAMAIVQSAGGPVAGYAPTDARGQYLVPDLAPGQYRVCFDTSSATVAGAPGGVLSGCHAGGDLVQVHHGSIRLGVDASLPAGGAVAGTVTGAHGSLVGVEVGPPGDEELTAFAIADSAGRYTVPGLPAGRYVVCAEVFDLATGGLSACHRAAGAKHRTPVTVRTARVTPSVGITLPGTGSLTATVTDTGGQPVSGVNVVVLDGCPDQQCGLLPLFDAHRSAQIAGAAMTDDQGRARFTLLRPSAGPYAVCTFTYYGAATAGDPADGYLDACTTYGSFGLTVVAGHDTPVAFTLHPASAVRGTVTDSHGHPLAGVRVRVSTSTSADYYDPVEFDEITDLFGLTPDGPAAEASTAPDGTYVVHGVRPGGRTVCFDAGDALDVTGATHPNGLLNQCVGAKPGSLQGGTAQPVPAGGTLAGVDQQLTDGAVITGRVLDRHTGHPLRDAAVMVFAGQTLIASDAVDAHGHYRLTDLAPGKVRVCFAAYPYEAQCYDGVAWPSKSVPASAAVLTLTAGGTLVLKDARLRRG